MRSGALYFAFYNFCRIHKTIKVSPAMAAGVTDKLWNMEDIVALIDARDERKGGEGYCRRLGFSSLRGRSR
jgi:hypothetical protein